MQNLVRTDPEVAEAIRNEAGRQGSQLELIASENFVSEAVLEALGTVLTNKYAECYPGKRYYGGCEFVDVAESLAIQRAKQLFAADHANVQPHSGAQANMSVYMTVCQPGDTILGMNLSHGGHLTHGHPLNFSGRYFKVVAYGVRKEDEQIDYEAMAALAREHRPKVLVVGASAYPRTIDFEAVRRAADECGAVVMADMAHIAGLVAAGLHPSPVPHAEFVTTTTHKTLRGPQGGHERAQKGTGRPPHLARPPRRRRRDAAGRGQARRDAAVRSVPAVRGAPRGVRRRPGRARLGRGNRPDPGPARRGAKIMGPCPDWPPPLRSISSARAGCWPACCPRTKSARGRHASRKRSAAS